MKLAAYLALIGAANAQDEEPEDDDILYDFYGAVMCSGFEKGKENSKCDSYKIYLEGVLDGIDGLFDEERSTEGGFRCAIPKNPDGDDYEYDSYLPLAETDNGSAVRVCVPKNWCFREADENVFNLEFEGTRNIIKFDGCKDDPKPLVCNGDKIKNSKGTGCECPSGTEDQGGDKCAKVIECIGG
jgi:hypothetical protein